MAGSPGKGASSKTCLPLLPFLKTVMPFSPMACAFSKIRPTDANVARAGRLTVLDTALSV
jgi:hypothetical protein